MVLPGQHLLLEFEKTARTPIPSAPVQLSQFVALCNLPGHPWVAPQIQNITGSRCTLVVDGVQVSRKVQDTICTQLSQGVGVGALRAGCP